MGPGTGTRASPLVFAVVLAACTSVTTSTAGAEPQVVTSLVATVSTTSTSIAPVATLVEVEEGCEGADRGWLCPPDLPEATQQAGFPVAGASFRQYSGAVLSPGTYRTRLFKPPFEFTVETSVFTGGEREEIVDLGGQADCDAGIRFPFEGRCLGVFVLGPFFPAVRDLEATFDDVAVEDCIVVQQQDETELFGRPATQTIILIGETTPEGTRCRWEIDLPAGAQMIVPGRHRVAFYQLEVSDQPLLVYVAAPEASFQNYFEEEAQPVLDSVVFLDE